MPILFIYASFWSDVAKGLRGKVGPAYLIGDMGLPPTSSLPRHLMAYIVRSARYNDGFTGIRSVRGEHEIGLEGHKVGHQAIALILQGSSLPLEAFLSLLFIALFVSTILIVPFSSIVVVKASDDSVCRKLNHKLTVDEVMKLKEKIGVREKVRNYNIVVDGHGTGLALPTEEEWNSIIGATFVDSVNTSVQASGSKRLDLEPYFPPVGNQGGQGSCCAWSTSYYANGFLQDTVLWGGKTI